MSQGDGPATPAIGVLMHVPLLLTAQLGACRLSVAQVLELGNGSIVELDRAAADPVDLYLNDARIGCGEIVAIDDRFGVRIVELGGL